MFQGMYNPTSDAVWLAAFAPEKFQTVLDVGIGTGGVSLCLLAHKQTAKITGIDISPEMLAECAKNAKLNNQQIMLINTDVLLWHTQKTFDLVITNPPYFKGTPAKHNAHHNVDLAKWFKKCVARVRPTGTICAIVDASSLATVISAISPICGGIEIFPLFSNKLVAERVLVRGKPGSKTGTIIHQGLLINDERVLREGLTIKETLSKIIPA